MFRNMNYLLDDAGNKYPVYVERINQTLYEPMEIICRSVHPLDFTTRKPSRKIDSIKRVIFNDPATIVLWNDGTKTVVKCQDGDIYDKEKGLALCIAKKYLGNKGNFNEVFKKWIPKENETTTIRKIGNTGDVCEFSFTVLGDQLVKSIGIFDK